MVLAIVIQLAVSLGVMNCFPRRRVGLAFGTASAFTILMLMTAFGGALVGVMDSRSLMTGAIWHACIAIAAATIWFFWKIKPQDRAPKVDR